MRGIISWLAAFILSAAGWWLGAFVGPGLAVFVSCVGLGVGLYYGRKWFDEWLG